MSAPICRGCGAALPDPFLSLGAMPPANAYLRAQDLTRPEPRFPLDVRHCPACHLVQVDPLVAPAELFTDYAYFSSYSTSWVEHARRFASAAIERLGLGPASRVVEIASNDGYLLRHFVAAGIPALGIEPAANVAAAAIAAGVPTEVRFFGRAAAEDLVARGLTADLVVANNVLAHVPDLHDFAAGLARLVKPRGRISIEFPHLLNLVAETQFDTIYHEHFSYFSLVALLPVLARHGLRADGVERLTTHGGSLRLWLATGAGTPASPVAAVLAEERAAGLDRAETYRAFAGRVAVCRASLRTFLAAARAEGRTVVAYGAAAKGNTLLNYCGVGADEIAFVVDRNPVKQGRFLPGSRLPIRDPGAIAEARPDYLLILPWNLADEITQQMAEIRGWGGRFVVPVPETRILP
jgi:SAM-dependent methyltransferase